MNVKMAGNQQQSNIPSIIVRHSSGIKFLDGPEKFSGNSSSFEDVEAKIKFFCISQNGLRMAWICNGEVCVVEEPKWERIGTLQHPKALEVFFSPSGKYLAIYDSYSGVDCKNLSIYDVLGKKLLKTFTQKNHEGWKPQWTNDEQLMGKLESSEVNFYESHDLEQYKQKATFAKMKSFSLSPSIKTHHCLIFVPSIKSSPGFVQLLKYPNFSERSAIIARQSFFKVDSVEAFWNIMCSAVLLLTTCETDKTSGSYYGEQHLFFLSTKGDSNRVTFSHGSIRSVSWCASGKEFCCVYGSAPAKASLLNLKCETIMEFGEGARNYVMFNPPGNLALIGAMGNVSSRFEVWDVKQGKKIGFRECPDITQMEWSPCGKYILTATCAPRLRVNNGFRIWHYTTCLLHENLWPEKEELFSASWLPDPKASSKTFEVSSKAVQGIELQVNKASKERYVPPSRRTGNTCDTQDSSTKFLSQRATPLTDEEKAKLLLKQKKLEKKRAKKETKSKEEQTNGENQKGKNRSDRDQWRDKSNADAENGEPDSAETSNKSAKKTYNRIALIKKKLHQIEVLKKEKANGAELKEAQLKKIETEESLLKELSELKI